MVQILLSHCEKLYLKLYDKITYRVTELGKKWLRNRKN